MTDHRYLSAAPRSLEIGVGVVLGLFAVSFAGVGIALFLRVRGEAASTSLLAVAAGFLIISALVFPKSYRLLRGEHCSGKRHLFSTPTLLVCGVIFLVGSVAMIRVNPLGLIEGLVLSSACFALARFRSKSRPSSNSADFKVDSIEPR